MFENSFHSLSANRKRPMNNISLMLANRPDGQNVLTVSKNPADTKDFNIGGPAGFVSVDVQSSSARVKFNQKNNDFELVSEQIQGPDSTSYDVVVRIFSC
jgi:hypothetical protein